MLLVCSFNVFALENEVDNVKKESDDGIFNWTSREERMNKYVCNLKRNTLC